ncbi:MAG: hypothetical protein KC620_03115 [Myxococcales bacterium]|nr:hypothetical protein [Myxococcales bacterium]
MHCGASLADDVDRLRVQADRFEQMERWSQAVTTRLELAERLEEPSERAEQFHSVGRIQQEQLGDPAAAAQSFDRALDADPSKLGAFESLDQLLVETGDLIEQARSYRRMIRRAIESSAEERVVIALARNLAELNRTHLKQPDAALDAIQLILERAPDDLWAIESAAQLHEELDDAPQAIEYHRRLLEIDPRLVESYRALRRVFLKEERYDAGWCICRVLSVLGQANTDELTFYERYATTSPTRAERPLQAAHWPLLDHQSKSPLLDELFARVCDALISLLAVPAKSLGIKRRRDLIDLAVSTRFTNVLGYLFEFLPVPPVEVFRCPEIQGMRPAIFEPPALLVHPDEMEEDLYHLAFVGGRYLTGLRPAHLFACSVADRAERRAYMLGLLRTLRATFDPEAGDLEHDPTLREALRRNLPPQATRALEELVQRMNEQPRLHFDIDRWLRAVDLTADRVGFIFANDLEKALANIRTGDASRVVPTVGERATELIRYAYSEEYFQVRRLIGHNID